MNSTNTQYPHPKVSVIMAAFNEEDCIENSLKSLINQTYKNWELIIIDDGSSDRTLEIIQRFQDLDDRVFLYSNPQNSGLAQSLNSAVEKTDGDYIARADADDISVPERLEKQVDFMLQNPSIDIAGSAAYLTNNYHQKGISKPALSHHEISNLPFLKTKVIHPSVIMKNSFFEKFGYYDCNLKRSEDKELWIRAIKNGARFANLEEPLIYYETDGYIRSWKSIINQTKDLYKISNNHKIRHGKTLTLKSLIYLISVKLGLKRPL